MDLEHYYNNGLDIISEKDINVEFTHEREKIDDFINSYTSRLENRKETIDKCLDEEVHYIKNIRDVKYIKKKIFYTTLANIGTSIFSVGLVYGGLYLFTHNFETYLAFCCLCGTFISNEYFSIKRILENGENIDINHLNHYLDIAHKYLLEAISDYEDEHNRLIEELKEMRNKLENEVNNANLLSTMNDEVSRLILQYYSRVIKYQEVLRDATLENTKSMLKEKNIPFK